MMFPKPPKRGKGSIPLKTRLLVLERDNYQCQRCGDTRDLHIHHRLPRGRGGTHDPENLVTLCGWRCHVWVEGNPEKAREEGWTR